MPRLPGGQEGVRGAAGDGLEIRIFPPQGQGRVDKSDRWFPKIGGNACKKDEREG